MTFRENCLARKIPIISQEVWSFLELILSIHKSQNCIEFWTANWYSSQIIWSAIQKHGGKLLSIEKSPDLHKEAKTNVKHLSNVNLFQWDILSAETKTLLDANKFFDFAFIDAKKSDYLNYLLLLEPFLSQNFIIVMDNTLKYKNKMENLFDYLSKNNYKVFNFDLNDEKKDWITILTWFIKKY